MGGSHLVLDQVDQGTSSLLSPVRLSYIVDHAYICIMNTRAESVSSDFDGG